MSNQSTTIQRGTRIRYTGDMANLPGTGAVVSVFPADQWSGETVDIALEDGRMLRRTPVRIIERQSAGCRYALIENQDAANDAEIAGLIAGCAIHDAKKAAAQQAEADARAEAIEQYRNSPEWAHLEQGDDRYSGKLAAKNIRKELKKAFPGVKFSVRKEHYGSVRISWEDARADVESVERIGNKYQNGHFDGMQDMYVHGHDPFNTVFGGSDFVFCSGPR